MHGLELDIYWTVSIELYTIIEIRTCTIAVPTELSVWLPMHVICVYMQSMCDIVNGFYSLGAVKLCVQAGSA